MPSDDVSLRDYFDGRLEEVWRSMADAEQSRQREHAADQRSIDTATESLEKRLVELNNFRDALGDQTKTFVTRELHDSLAAEVERRVSAAQADVDRRFDDDRRAISLLQADNSKLQGALAIARYVGFGGLMTGLGALVWVLLHTQGAL